MKEMTKAQMRVIMYKLELENEGYKSENEKLRKQVTIAVNALEWYADYTNSTKGVFNMKPEKEAQDALKQIKELEK